MRGAAILAVCGPLLLASPAMADRVGVRLGDHPGHGRIVLDLAAPDAPFRVEEGPDAVLIRLGLGLEADVPAPRRLPRNLLSLSRAEDGLRLTLRPGTRLRHYRLGNRLVLDVLDGPAAAPVPGASAPTPGPEAAARPRPTQRQARAGRGARTPDPAPQPVPVTVVPVTPPPVLAEAPRQAAVPPPPEPPRNAPSQPIQPTALPLRAISGDDGRALVLPLPAETGMAILRRGDTLLVVLDQPHALDAAPLRNDPVFGALRVDTLPEATILRLPLAAPAALRARRDGDRWLLTASPTAGRERSILAEPESGRVVMRVASPGRPVPIADPETGLPILVGTVREPGQAMPAPRSLAQLDFLPTQLGVAALARADSAGLRRTADRFVLSGITGAATLDLAFDAGSMTRLMELPALDPTAAQERLRAQQASLAATPPLARLPLRRAAAEGMLALGLAQEAQAMIRLAFQEDPRASSDPRSLLVHGAAALLASRISEAQGLSTATLPAQDEVILWRAALAASGLDAAAAAPGFAATLPLLLAYPEPVRARLLPLAAEALAEANDRPALTRLLKAAGDRPDLALARARLAEAEGRTEEALRLYADVAEGRDRLSRARALRRSIELRLAAGTLDTAGAAASMEAALYAWRGDAEEFGARLRIASLRQQAGGGRGALDLLKETGEAFPDRGEQLRPAQEAALLHALLHEPPTLAVALSETHGGLLPRDDRAAEALSLLAERLAAIDLPDRGAALAQQAIERSSPARRPAMATRLAALRLNAGDPAGALTAMQATPAPDEAVPRGLLAARAKAALGEGEEAVSILRSLGTAGLPALGALLAERQDWAGASDALLALANDRPEDPASAREVLRAAAFAALGQDMARLTALRGTWLPRLGGGPIAEAVRLLTADPVRGVSDLPRMQRELDLFRGFPNKLEAFRTAAATSR
ncbi:hypothetical protein [Roseomonas sp. WA12]